MKLTMEPCSAFLKAAAAKIPAAPAGQATAATDEKQAKADPEEEAEIQKNLAKLSPEDRKLVEAQRFCAIEEDHRLGGMAVPFKVMLKGKPVFLCCGGCKKEALAEPDKTLAKAEELKAKNTPAEKKQ